MLGKIGFVMGVTVLAMFMMGRVESLAAHRGFGGSTAWAQQGDDPAGDASPQDAFVAQPDAVPDVSGTWSGALEDHRFGHGDVFVEISQNGSKLSGSWDSNLDNGVGGGLKGKVRPNNKVHLRLKIKGNCGLNAQGTFQNGDEIAGNYQANGCSKSDHGSFDIFR